MESPAFWVPLLLFNVTLLATIVYLAWTFSRGRQRPRLGIAIGILGGLAAVGIGSEVKPPLLKNLEPGAVKVLTFGALMYLCGAAGSAVGARLAAGPQKDDEK